MAYSIVNSFTSYYPKFLTLLQMTTGNNLQVHFDYNHVSQTWIVLACDATSMRLRAQVYSVRIWLLRQMGPQIWRPTQIWRWL